MANKRKKKYYQWVLVHNNFGICTDSRDEYGGKVINDQSGYFTKEKPPLPRIFLGGTHKWVPVVETEREI